MPIKLTTPAPLTFELQSDPGRNPFFYARERPELSIHLDSYGELFVNYNGVRCSTGKMSFAEAECFANELHARLCTFEQPQTVEVEAEPEKPCSIKLWVCGDLKGGELIFVDASSYKPINPKAWSFCQEVEIKLPE